MTTAEYNADNPFVVTNGNATGRKAGKTSYVFCQHTKSFDWRLGGANPHPLGRLDEAYFMQVCERLNQIIQLA